MLDEEFKKYSVVTYDENDIPVDEFCFSFVDINDAWELYNDYYNKYQDELNDKKVKKVVLGNNETMEMVAMFEINISYPVC